MSLDLKCPCCEHVLESGSVHHKGVLINALITQNDAASRCRANLLQYEKRKDKNEEKVKFLIEHMTVELKKHEEELARLKAIQSQVYPS